ncbi:MULTISPECIES: DUF6325 family protein [unclassified Streptomyces]|uniref:DUF6325 family protein n=1 Tax=unclassified Streptomyces TaxID=2593676 RepID=UPI001BEA596B|nr:MULTISPECIES: DUF6325 family protein [unclassified Streptomyces]MBT2407583.1 hypothetical protein [Streptomyces sp. ISL-21]MBT2459108.1 hypothetical protein [Streptomyces sp. ISL-86]MBT2611577.1 hypothetical protein [Streptomyces sp. ISL-87]
MSELGPVDLIILSFPGVRPPDAVLRGIEEVERRNDVRILDALVVTKEENGEVERVELSDIEDLRDAAADLVARSMLGLVGIEDVDEIAALMDVGTTVLALLVENVWARELATAVRRHDGRLVATVRIPHEQITEAEADLAAAPDAGMP